MNAFRIDFRKQERCANQMATRRFILYIDTQDQRDVLATWLRSQTHIQLVSKLGQLPTWLQQAPRPVLVDMLTQEAAWGSELEGMMQARKPPSKFSPVEDID